MASWQLIQKDKNKEIQLRRQEIETRLKQIEEPAKNDRETRNDYQEKLVHRPFHDHGGSAPGKVAGRMPKLRNLA
ncbi:MAG: hypothetical protein WCD70_06010 [Alphaproteobacteria bacterium]